MGIINALLTGGVIAGKICQSLLGNNQDNSYLDSETGITVAGAIASGGVTFFSSNASGNLEIYAYNTNTSSYATVAVPNDQDSSGVLYIIPPTQKVLFGEANSPQVPPSTDITTSLTNTPPTANGPVSSLLKLAFKDLKIGNVVNVGSFQISCTTSQLAVVTTGISLTSITYFWFSSNKGVTATNQNNIPASNSPTSSGNGGVSSGTQAQFSIDFESLGFDVTNDNLQGQITLSTSSTSTDLLILSKEPPQSLHPAEQRFFNQLKSSK